MAAEIITQHKPASGTRAGANALQALIREIGVIGNETVFRFGDDGEIDGRDYVAMAALVEHSINQNIVHGTAVRSAGYLRALTDALCMFAEGVLPCNGWDPIQNTAQAFGEGNHG